MLKKRIIPCLDIKDGRTVKGINFDNITDAGNPIELANSYVEQGADELVFLDITATIENRATLIELVKEISKEINIPFTVGGGIRSVGDVYALLNAGADKVSINSAAVDRPTLITDIADEFGSQCVVVAIDTKYMNNQWMVYVSGGRRATGLETVLWAKKIEELGGGEILLTSMDSDGMKNGFSLDITRQIASEINLPVIASGGAGSMQHFKDLYTSTEATGALAASIFHYDEVKIPDLKQYLHNNKIPVRWK